MNRTGWLALLLVTTTVLAGCSDDPEPTSAPTVAASVQPAASTQPETPSADDLAWPANLREAGFLPPAAGSLGADTEWVEALRKQVLKHVAKHNRDRKPPAAEDITVVSAGDVGQVRYAEMYFPSERRKDEVMVWVRFWWVGEAGADGSEMQAWINSSTHDEPETEPDALFLTYRNGSPGGVALISAPGAKSVTLVGEGAELEPDGGAGWVAEVGKAELREAEEGRPIYRVDGVEWLDNVSSSWPQRG